MSSYWVINKIVRSYNLINTNARCNLTPGIFYVSSCIYRLTVVGRSTHGCGTIVLQMWDERITRVGRLNHLGE